MQGVCSGPHASIADAAFLFRILCAWLRCQVKANLVVLNLSQHTDSSDLLGGFRPVEARHSLVPLLPAFYDLVQQTWPRGRNDDYLSRVMKAAQRSKWAVVSKAVGAAVAKVGLSGCGLPALGGCT